MPGAKRTYNDYDRLVERYRKFILFLCHRASYGRVEMSRELLQECYVELLQRLPELDAAVLPPREAAWVYVRCRVAIGRYQRRLARAATLPLPRDMEERLVSADESESQFVVGDFAACLREPERRFFLLMAQGADDEELAQALGVKHRTVIQMKHNIKKKFKEFVYGEENM